MGEATKGFYKGLNRDLAKSKYDANTYEYASNFRVNTDEGMSAGSLENEKGHILSFKIPNIPSLYLPDGTVLPQQENLKIIGIGTILDTIVIFTTNNNSETPTNSYGQLWRCIYDEATDKIIGLDTNGYLTVADHLIYNRIPNLSTYYTIKRIIGRYENKDTQRVYWTDNYNNVRTFNIATADPMLVDPGSLDLMVDTTLSQPVPFDIGNGTLPAATVVQFSYRLLSEGGAESLYAPCSVLYPLSKTSIYTPLYQDFEGDGNSQVDLTKSVSYTIQDIDTRFKYIEHIIIIYDHPEMYTIYKFDEQLIPSNGKLTITCSSITDAIIINPVEFNILSSGFSIAKDIEVKNRRLIAANTKTTQFDVDFDSRVYRFDNTQEARIYKADGTFITIDGTAPDYNIPDDHDCINRFNDEQAVDWQQNMYQADGVTIGGTGPNISYKFVTRDVPGDFQNTTAISVQNPHTDLGRWSIGVGTESIGVTNGDGTNQEIVRADQFKNNASAYFPAFYRGYARGEVYRFGIVFDNKKGSSSFVKWIGDIKFPEPTDGFPIQDVIGGLPYQFTLGIEFNVDITSIQNDISAFRIVRVKREEADKTRLGSGIQMYFDRHDSADTNTLIDAYYTATTGFPFGYLLSNDANIYNLLDTTGYCLYDRPGYPSRRAGLLGETDRLSWLCSPIGQLNSGFTSKSGDYTKTTGYYKTIAKKYHLGSHGLFGITHGFYYKCYDFVALPHAREWYEIQKARILEAGEYVPANGDLINGLTASTLRNTSYSKETAATGGRYVPFGLGNRKLAATYTTAPSIYRNDGDPTNAVLWYNDGTTTGDYYNNAFDAAGDYELQDSWHKEVLYCRPRNNQYGGETFLDRGANSYISTGHYQLNNNATHTFKVYGGDTFVSYFDDESISFYMSRNDAYLDPYNDPTDFKLSIAHVVPCESSINYDYNVGKRWAADRDGTDYTSMTTFGLPTNFYNFVFSQENNTELKFYAKDAVRKFSEEQPHRLWASDNKLDGELVDSWRKFSVNNITEVNGIHGPINRLVNYRDRLFFYQDKAFGIASIDDQSVITDESGQTMVLGTGGIFPNYGYISVNTGTVHQLAVAATEGGLYHYDARLKKIYKYSDGPQPLSDIKGMSSWFSNEIQGAIRNTDLLTINSPTGIVAAPDFRYNRVLFTFLNHKPVKHLSTIDALNATQSFLIGDVILIDGIYYEFTENQTISLDGVRPPLLVRELPNYINGFTISYNEAIEAFESFYDYKPSLYLNYGRRLLSVNPYSGSDVYQHNVGDYAKYYDKPAFQSKLLTLLNDKGLTTKIFNNIAYKSELYDTNKNDVYNETFNRIRFYNEYQDTGILNLDSNNIKRRIRTWHHSIGRDKNNRLSRMRNPWLNLLLEYDNNLNKRHVLHEIIYNYTVSEY